MVAVCLVGEADSTKTQSASVSSEESASPLAVDGLGLRRRAMRPMPEPSAAPAAGGVEPDAAGKVWPFEEMVISKLYKMSADEAVAYLESHSTRFYLKKAGIADAVVADALAVVKAAK